MYVLWIVLAFILIFIIKTIRGPTVWDRLLGSSLVSVKIIVLIIAIASIYDLPYLLDYAIIHTLFGFISIIFISYFIVMKMKGGEE